MANGGFAVNCNAGAVRATGDVLFFVNQDVYAVQEWSQSWDAAILEPFNDPKVGIVGARLLTPIGTIQSAGGVFDTAAQPVHRCLGYSNPHHPEVATPREVEWVTGAALAIRRDLWIQLGGFDTIYERGYFEDVDICMRAREAGLSVWYEPRCTLFHAVGSTGGNPRFAANARLWRDRWVYSGKVKAGTTLATIRYW